MLFSETHCCLWFYKLTIRHAKLNRKTFNCKSLQPIVTFSHRWRRLWMRVARARPSAPGPRSNSLLWRHDRTDRRYGKNDKLYGRQNGWTFLERRNPNASSLSDAYTQALYAQNTVCSYKHRTHNRSDVIKFDVQSNSTCCNPYYLRPTINVWRLRFDVPHTFANLFVIFIAPFTNKRDVSWLHKNMQKTPFQANVVIF